MAIGDTDVELQFTNIVANVPIVVGIQNTGVQTEITVRYGIQRFTATLGVDYSLVFPVDLLTFQLTPTQSLIDKITAAGGTNVIFVRRDLPLTSDFDYDNAFVRQKLVDEFNRVWMTLQQQNYRIGLASPVTSWNNRVDDVYLFLSDITAVGGAPIQSPTFTGYPASTTPVHGDTSTRIATTAFVSDAVYTAVTQNAVTSFNGRQGTVTLTWSDVSGVGGAPIASPVFTGNPQAPTPTLGDNDTSIATTAFVQAALASGVAGVTSWNARTGNVVFTSADITGVGGALASQIPIASTTTPLMAGAGAVGSSTTWARADHVHPTDIGAASVAVSDTPPALPAQGKLWFDSISAQLYVRYDDGNSAQWVVAVNNTPDLSGYLPLTGGTLTGALHMVGGGNTIDNPVGNGRPLAGRKGTLNRWAIDLGDSSAESGSNAGANFGLYRYDDAGVFIDTPIFSPRNVGGVWTKELNIINSPSNYTVLNLWDFYGGNNRAAIYYSHASGSFTVANNLAGSTIAFDSVGSISVGTVGAGAFYAASAAYKPGGGAWSATSDARIKDVVGEYKEGLAEVIQLRPVIYTYKGNDTPIADVNETGRMEDVPKADVTAAPYPASPHFQPATAKKPYVGLIAQDVETIFPGMVSQRAGFIDGKPVDDLKDIDTTPLIFALVNAVKELKAEIEALKGTR